MTLAQTPTEVASDPPAERPSAAARKVAAVAAALFAVALFMTVASVDVPHDPTDSDLLQWWQQQGNRTSGLASGISAICVAVAVAVVMNYLPRLAATERAPQWTAFARSMGAAVTAVWLVTGAARAAVSHLVDVMGEPLPGVDVLRFATALNYTLLGLSGMAVLSLCILAVSIVVVPHPGTGPVDGIRRSRVWRRDARCSGRPIRRVRDAARHPLGAVPRRRDLASAG